MFIASWVVVALLGIFLLAQAIPIVGFAKVLRRWQPTPLDDQACPPVAVILCLRGCDRFLPDCLKGLFNQDYPDYRVHVVVDREDDPAWGVVMQALEESGASGVRVEPLR